MKYQIYFYQAKNGGVYFDDPSKNIKCEDLCRGLDDIWKKIAKKWNADVTGCNWILSNEPVEGAEELHFKEYISDGHTYTWHDDVGYVCPTIYKYFESLPKIIYLKPIVN